MSAGGALAGTQLPARAAQTRELRAARAGLPVPAHGRAGGAPALRFAERRHQPPTPGRRLRRGCSLTSASWQWPAEPRVSSRGQAWQLRPKAAPGGLEPRGHVSVPQSSCDAACWGHVATPQSRQAAEHRLQPSTSWATSSSDRAHWAQLPQTRLGSAHWVTMERGTLGGQFGGA